MDKNRMMMLFREAMQKQLAMRDAYNSSPNHYGFDQANDEANDAIAQFVLELEKLEPKE
jgi:hypothetical protein